MLKPQKTIESSEFTFIGQIPLLDLKKLAAFCFDHIRSTLDQNNKTDLALNLNPFDTALFVTWNKRNSLGEEILRGCTGTFKTFDLHQLLPVFACNSAFNDTRFEPIRLDELKHLSCCVSLLYNFEKITDIFDWTIGVHGLSIKFTSDGVNYNATFLPNVIVEEKWTKQETLEFLTRKSGFKGDMNEILPSIEAERYSSRLASCTHDEYSKLKEQILKEKLLCKL